MNVRVVHDRRFSPVDVSRAKVGDVADRITARREKPCLSGFNVYGIDVPPEFEENRLAVGEPFDLRDSWLAKVDIAAAAKLHNLFIPCSGPQPKAPVFVIGTKFAVGGHSSPMAADVVVVLVEEDLTNIHNVVPIGSLTFSRRFQFGESVIFHEDLMIGFCEEEKEVDRFSIDRPLWSDNDIARKHGDFSTFSICDVENHEFLVAAGIRQLFPIR